MEKTIIQVVLMMISKLYSKELIDAVKALIMAQLSNDLSGDDKKKEVRKQLLLAEGAIANSLKKVSSMTVNLIIEIVVNYLRVTGTIPSNTFIPDGTSQQLK